MVLSPATKNSTQTDTPDPANDPVVPFEPNAGYLELQHNHLDYTDDWPEVEVTVHVLDCSGLNLALSTFDLDFVVILDWLDFQLVENEHFGFDSRWLFCPGLCTIVIIVVSSC